MAKYNVHGGHNSIVPGAAKYLNEVTEDRKVKNKVISLLKAAGHTVYDCTDDSGQTQSKNLANIVSKCNKHGADLDISIHLNAGGGTGTEVLYTSPSGKAWAEKVSKAVASALGIRNRGARKRDNLYVLNHTKSTAILVECCFVDSRTDKNAWDADKCAEAIVEAVTGKVVSSESSSGSGSSSETNSDHGGTPGHYWATMRMEYPNYSNEHRWIVHKHSDNTYSLKNVEATTYMSVRDGKMAENQEVWAYSWNETKSQRFVLEQAECSDITSCVYLKCASDNNYVLASDGEKLCIQKKKGNFAQRWVLIPTGLEDEYYILNYGSGKAIGVKYK